MFNFKARVMLLCILSVTNAGQNDQLGHRSPRSISLRRFTDADFPEATGSRPISDEKIQEQAYERESLRLLERRPQPAAHRYNLPEGRPMSDEKIQEQEEEREALQTIVTASTSWRNDPLSWRSSQPQQDDEDSDSDYELDFDAILPSFAPDEKLPEVGFLLRAPSDYWLRTGPNGQEVREDIGLYCRKMGFRIALPPSETDMADVKPYLHRLEKYTTGEVLRDTTGEVAAMEKVIGVLQGGRPLSDVQTSTNDAIKMLMRKDDDNMSEPVVVGPRAADMLADIALERNEAALFMNIGEAKAGILLPIFEAGDRPFTDGSKYIMISDQTMKEIDNHMFVSVQGLNPRLQRRSSAEDELTQILATNLQQTTKDERASLSYSFPEARPRLQQTTFPYSFPEARPLTFQRVN